MVIAELALTRPARRPVWLVLWVNGQIATRRPLHPRSDLDDSNREHPRILASFMAEAPRAVPVPNVTDMDEVLVTAEEEGGETLARYTVALPGQDLIDGVIGRAVPVLEAMAADFRNRCWEDRGG